MVSRVSYPSPCSIFHEGAAHSVGEGLCYRNRSRIGTRARLRGKSRDAAPILTMLASSTSSGSLQPLVIEFEIDFLSETVTLIRNSAESDPSAGSWARKPDVHAV